MASKGNSEYNINNYSNDFLTMVRARELVKRDLMLSDNRPASEIRPILGSTDGGMWRCAYPHGKRALHDFWKASLGGEEGNPWVVGFFGHKKARVDDSVVKQIWQLDVELIKNLHLLDHVLCYSSIQFSKDQDWMNLVLLKSEQGLSQWLSGVHHREASKALSPYYYSQVRIHIVQLEGGIESRCFQLNRTTFLDYEKYHTKDSVEGYRFVKKWNKAAWKCQH